MRGALVRVLGSGCLCLRPSKGALMVMFFKPHKTSVRCVKATKNDKNDGVALGEAKVSQCVEEFSKL